MVSNGDKHIFGVVKVGTKGQIVIPSDARKMFNIECGDNLIILGDEKQGLALVKADELKKFANAILDMGEDGNGNN